MYTINLFIKNNYKLTKPLLKSNVLFLFTTIVVFSLNHNGVISTLQNKSYAGLHRLTNFKTTISTSNSTLDELNNLQLWWTILSIIGKVT